MFSSTAGIVSSAEVRAEPSPPTRGAQQLFAWALARTKGLDPDKPRGLSKVTLRPLTGAIYSV